MGCFTHRLEVVHTDIGLDWCTHKFGVVYVKKNGWFAHRRGVVYSQVLGGFRIGSAGLHLGLGWFSHWCRGLFTHSAARLTRQFGVDIAVGWFTHRFGVAYA